MSGFICLLNICRQFLLMILPHHLNYFDQVFMIMENQLSVLMIGNMIICTIYPDNKPFDFVDANGNPIAFQNVISYTSSQFSAASIILFRYSYGPFLENLSLKSSLTFIMD